MGTCTGLPECRTGLRSPAAKEMLIPLALDTETALIRAGAQAPELACVSVHSRAGGGSGLIHWTEFNPPVTWALTDPRVLIVGHTVAYDMSVLGAADPSLLPLIFKAYRENRITCTEVRAKMLDIATGKRKFHEDESGEAAKSTYALDALAQRFLNRKLDKNTWRLQYGELRKYPLSQWPDGARQYPIEDARATEDIFFVQDVPENQPYLQDQFRQARAAFWIKLMACWGIRTDAQAIWELSERTNQDYEALATDLREIGLLRPDKQIKRKGTGIIETEPGSRDTKAAAQRLIAAYAAQGKDYPRTKTGLKPALDEQACIDSLDPELIKYARLTSLRSVLSKDVPALETGIRVPIHSRFDSMLENGRTSSSGNAETGGMNIQNIRRLPGIRECFVPRCLQCGHVHGPEDIRRGHCLNCPAPLTVFITSDFRGAELCTLAQVCLTVLNGFSCLAQALNAGRDPHMMIAEDILHTPYDLLKEIHGKGSQSDCTAGKGRTACLCVYCRTDNGRQTGKVGNFGFPGGLGPAALVYFALGNYGVRMTEDEARELKRTWNNRWPEMKEFFRFVDWHVKQSPAVIRQLFSDRYRGFGDDPRAYTEACNTMFSGLAADMAKDAGFEICEACYVPSDHVLFGSRMVNFVHDEFILEVPEPMAHECAMAVKQIMLDAGKRWVPDVRIDCETLVTRRLSKKAKPVWKDGRLIPWG